MEAARGTGLLVLPGMELCTAEEAHVVCLFPALEGALAFEAAVRPTLPPVENRPDIFGEQLLLDAQDGIVGRETLLLTTASGISVDEVLGLARKHGGTAFPAHIDRPSYSVTAALGDLPPLGLRGRWKSPPGGTWRPYARSTGRRGGKSCCAIPTPIISTKSPIPAPGWSYPTRGRRRSSPPWTAGCPAAGTDGRGVRDS